MKILLIEKEISGIKPGNFRTHLEDEARHVWSLYKSDVIREIYFTNEHNAVIIMEADSKEKVSEIVKKFPLVKNGLITFDIYELNNYDGFERLMK